MMISARRLLTFLPTGLLCLAFFAAPLTAQDGPVDQQAPAQLSTTDKTDASSGQSGKDTNGSESYSGGFLPNTFPDPFKRHLVGQFSIGEVRDSGITNGLFPGPVGIPLPNGIAGLTSGKSPDLFDSEISASFAYDLQQKHSDYLFDYRVSPRHYPRYPQLDVISQDVGLHQVLDLGPRTKWTLNYRFSMNPDLAGSLMAETLTQQMSFINPLPVVGIRGIPTFGTPFQPLLSPADGLITLRSMQMTNSTYAGLSHELSPQTELSFQAGFSRLRFQDKNLFGDNQYSASGAISHMLSPGMSVGISFNAGRLDLAQAFLETTNAGVGLMFTRQLGRRGVLTLSAGPARIETRGQETISLPTLLANLLGRTSLNRTTSQATMGWLGAATVSTNIHSVGISLSYNRSITNSGGLGGASLTQTGAVRFSKEFRQRTVISAGLSYNHLLMLGMVNPIRIDQEGITGTFTRKLTRAIDFSTFFLYAKSMTGRHGPTLLNHNQVGVSFVYHLHRLEPTGQI